MISLPECPISGYTIRPATEADLNIIVEMDRSHMKAEVEKLYPGGWDEKNARTIVADNLQRACVLLFQGHVVGAFYWWIEEPSTAVMHSIQVVPGHRSKGLGRWLMSCFEAAAKADGLKRVGLTVFRGNRAIELYKRLGYKVTGTDGPNAIEMQKIIAI